MNPPNKPRKVGPLGRWALSAMAVAGGLLMSASQAQAGTWNIKLEIARPDNGTNQGTLTYDNTSGPFGPNSWGTNSFSHIISLNGVAQNGVPVTLGQSVTYTVRLRYIPTANDPTDVPPQMVAVQLQGFAGGHYAPPPAGYTGGTGSITGSTGLTDTALPPGTNRGVSIDINGSLLVTGANPTRATDLTLGPFSATTSGHLPNAYKVFITYDRMGNSTGSFNSYAMQDIGISNALSGSFCSFLPSPNNLALDDGATPARGLNQYVIDGVMPTSISWGVANTTFANWLKNNVSWNLIGAAPALRSVDTYITSSTSVAPGHFPLVLPTPQPTPVPPPSTSGFEFDVRTSPATSSTSNVGWNFPFDNVPFGEKILNHVVGTTTVPAPVALFFPSTGFQHPTGGPTMVDGSTDGVPNYIYYYSKAYSAPWGTEVRFWNESSSAYGEGQPFVRVGTDSHGLSNGGPNGTIDADGGIDTDLFAILPSNNRLVWVGGQRIRGLDLYARNVYHECVHRQLYMYRQRTNIPDNDGDGLPDNADTDNDGLPDSIEGQIGTLVDENNSVPWDPPYQNGTYSDQESFCRMCERDLPVPDTDWADDGFNFGRPAAPNRNQRVVEYFWSGYSKNSVQWVDARALVPVAP